MLKKRLRKKLSRRQFDSSLDDLDGTLERARDALKASMEEMQATSERLEQRVSSELI
jgi:hypothetical protein